MVWWNWCICGSWEHLATPNLWKSQEHFIRVTLRVNSYPFCPFNLKFYSWSLITYISNYDVEFIAFLSVSIHYKSMHINCVPEQLNDGLCTVKLILSYRQKYEPRSQFFICDIFFLNIHHTKLNHDKHFFQWKCGRKEVLWNILFLTGLHKYRQITIFARP